MRNHDLKGSVGKAEQAGFSHIDTALNLQPRFSEQHKLGAVWGAEGDQAGVDVVQQLCRQPIIWHCRRQLFQRPDGQVTVRKPVFEFLLQPPPGRRDEQHGFGQQDEHHGQRERSCRQTGQNPGRCGSFEVACHSWFRVVTLNLRVIAFAHGDSLDYPGNLSSHDMSRRVRGANKALARCIPAARLGISAWVG